MKSMCELIQKYVRDKKGTEVSIEEIRNRPHHEMVGIYWDAIAHYGGRDFYFSLDDVEPEDDKWIFVRQQRGVWTQYVCHQGEWVEVGELNISMYK